MRLTLATARALLGRWGAAAVPTWILLAAVLSFDEVLGAASMGTYLAYVALLPMAGLLRLGQLRERRLAEGWDPEERLRDPRGWRMPMAECAAALLLLAVALALALVPTWFSAFHVPRDDASFHRARVVDEQDAGWAFHVRAPAPPGSTLVATFSFDALPPEGSVTVVDAAGRRQEVVPGENLAWRLDAEQARAGLVRLRPAEAGAARAVGMRALPDLARLRVPIPRAEALPGLLAGLFLFFWPLYSLLLLCSRRLRVHGMLAAFSVLALGGLAAHRPPEQDFLPDSPVGWLARAFLVLGDALPEVSGLHAVGHGFELRAGTARLPAILAWSAIGVLALVLATRRPRPRP